MKTFARRPRRLARNPAPDLDGPRELQLDCLRRSVAAYREADRMRAESRRRYDAACEADPQMPFEIATRWETWVNHAYAAMSSAEDVLVEAILHATGRLAIHDEIPKLGADWAPCAFELDKVLYVVRQDPEEDHKARPLLTVVDTTRDYDADWCEIGG